VLRVAHISDSRPKAKPATAKERLHNAAIEELPAIRARLREKALLMFADKIKEVEALEAEANREE
jgi:hypothetical protein